ncbi:MAG: DUF2304 domain-containing protein [Bacteroidetes bacterium]|nr:MAG: DUF2304 domain-containing protein [Bacteroidota bacterium]
MKPIQLFLIPLLLVLLLWLEARLRRQGLLRAVLILIFLTAMVLVAFPEWSTVVAHAVGIGRGVDLVTYLSLLGLTVSCVLLYVRQLKLQRQLTELARAQALASAMPPGNSKEEEG